MSASAIYSGEVYHRRLGPRPHAFRYRAHFLYLDLCELDEGAGGTEVLTRPGFGPARFRRSDYLGPRDTDLDEAVRDRVEVELDRRPTGPVRILTQVRTFGYVFNPVSFYYCFDEQGQLDAVVAEITNTPWKERHAYVLDARENVAEHGLRASFPKDFHVSPFFGMDQTYDWRFSEPGEELGVHMTNLEQGQAVFHAGMTCKRTALDRRSLRRALWLQPLQPLRVVAAIYLQAALLWLKRTPFHVHPDKQVHAAPAKSS